MLTFEFTGVEGRMTGSEILTSGMVGKTVQILFDESWTNLTKTLVFRAGQIQATAPGDTSPVVIPANVLAHPFQKLFVGAYGTDRYGNLVIPTMMAEGPMIRYGTMPEELPADGNLTCRKLQAQIGDLNQLQTDARTSLVDAINELTGCQGGMSKEAIALLITILRHALYESNQRDTIDALEEMLNAPSTEPEIPDVSATLTHITAVYTGNSVPVGTNVHSLAGLTVTAHYSDGSSAVVTGYGINGAITKAGTNTLSVVYNGQSTTVSVTGYEAEKTLTGITANYTGGNVAVNTELTALYPNLSVIAQFSDGTTERVVGYSLSGSISNVGANVITVTYGGLTTTFTVTGAEVQVQSEILEIVYTASYPNVTTFAYTEQSNAGIYAVAKRGNLKGGLLSVDFDASYATNWNLNLYVFDAEGNPYMQTDKTAADGDAFELYWGTNEPKWEAVGAGAGFGSVSAPFQVQLPAGCSCIACFRSGQSGISDFTTWAKNGGITFTVTAPV